MNEKKVYELILDTYSEYERKIKSEMLDKLLDRNITLNK